MASSKRNAEFHNLFKDVPMQERVIDGGSAFPASHLVPLMKPIRRFLLWLAKGNHLPWAPLRDGQLCLLLLQHSVHSVPGGHPCRRHHFHRKALHGIRHTERNCNLHASYKGRISGQIAAGRDLECLVSLRVLSLSRNGV